MFSVDQEKCLCVEHEVEWKGAAYIMYYINGTPQNCTLVVSVLRRIIKKKIKHLLCRIRKISLQEHFFHLSLLSFLFKVPSQSLSPTILSSPVPFCSQHYWGIIGTRSLNIGVLLDRSLSSDVSQRLVQTIPKFQVLLKVQARNSVLGQTTGQKSGERGSMPISLLHG